MSAFLNILVCPNQRRRRVQPEVEGLSDAVSRLYEMDLSTACWAERREGTLARMEGGEHPEMLARIPSAKLDCTVLLLYLREGGGWGYRLCARGTVEDAFDAAPGESAPPDPASPEQHASRLVRRFKADREKLLACLTRAVPERDGFQTEALEAFLGILAPWAWELFTSDQLTPASPPPANPRENTPARTEVQRPLEPEPGPEACLPFLSKVKVLRRGWPFPLSLLYAFFPQKHPAPEEVPFQGWTARELESILEDFYSGKLDRLELSFALNGAGTYVRRLKKTVYHPFRLTLELIREKGRCMCLLLDDQQPTLYRLVSDRNTYMNVDIKDLKKTVFHGQTVDEYTVFPKKDLRPLRRELPLLLARLDRRDGVLSATARMGVWSCEGLNFNREQYQQFLDAWTLS
ncbi:hypothetical protein AALA54_12600 [Oscillospiraceae bacterium 44-34]